MTFPARTLFACWLTVVATGTSVAHRHAAEASHTHGFGWVALGGPLNGTTAHHHFVFCGVEFWAGEGDPADTPDGAHPTLTTDARPAPDTGSSGEQPTAPLGHCACPFGSGFFDGGRSTGPTAPPIPFSPPVSPARSGVLRL